MKCGGKITDSVISIIYFILSVYLLIVYGIIESDPRALKVGIITCLSSICYLIKNVLCPCLKSKSTRKDKK